MEPETAESPTRERTRRAIVLAALEVLSGNPRASLADIADRAGVARSTLHRYYADRAALLRNIGAFVEGEYAAVLSRARIDEGTGFEAFERLASELLDALDTFSWWMGAMQAAAVDNPELIEEAFTHDEEDVEIADIIVRGRRDGTIDPLLDSRWASTVLWSTLYATWTLAKAGAVTRAEARTQCLRSLLRAIAA